MPCECLSREMGICGVQPNARLFRGTAREPARPRVSVRAQQSELLAHVDSVRAKTPAEHQHQSLFPRPMSDRPGLPWRHADKTGCIAGPGIGEPDAEPGATSWSIRLEAREVAKSYPGQSARGCGIGSWPSTTPTISSTVRKFEGMTLSLSQRTP